MFSIKADFDRAERMLSDLGRKQLPFATALALNDTAEAVKQAEELDIAATFDRPTPFTKRALYLRRASKARMVAQVGAKGIQAKYLIAQVTGGRRSPFGAALVVPVKARLNKYGNLPKGAIRRAKAKPGVFVASRGGANTRHLSGGIYERIKGKGGGLKLLASFEDSADYGARWKFHDLAMRRARVVFRRQFIARMEQAIATAK